MAALPEFVPQEAPSIVQKLCAEFSKSIGDCIVNGAWPLRYTQEDKIATKAFKDSIAESAHLFVPFESADAALDYALWAFVDASGDKPVTIKPEDLILIQDVKKRIFK